MAVNEWVNGYLEAILDVGSSTRKRNDGKLKITKFDDDNKDQSEEKSFSPIKYFVEEVVNSFDESHLHRTWVKIAWDDAQNIARRRLDREQGRNDAANDLSELSEGEKDKGDANASESIKDNISRISSEMQLWSDDDKSRNLYIVLISIHGLVRGENMELGRDSDTGGQVKYVVELAQALAKTKGVYRVDLFDCCRYIPKESLWPYIPEFVDGALNHIVNLARAIGDQVNGGNPMWPYDRTNMRGAEQPLPTRIMRVYSRKKWNQRQQGRRTSLDE